MPVRTLWYQQSPRQVAEELGVEPARGLDEAEVIERRARYGPNALPSAKPPGFLQLLVRQFTSFIILLLLAAAGISLALGERLDAVAILAALLLNAAVGVAMDYRAEREIASIQALTAPRARVRRAGTQHELAAEELVPGDVLLLEAGDRVPADGRLIAGACDVDESLLTGESVPVRKSATLLAGEELPLAERRNEVFAATTVARGAATVLVTSTGTATEVGRIGRLLAATERPAPPITSRLELLGRYLVWTVAAVTLIIVLLGLVQGRPFWPLLETAVVLAIAAIPEGLPTVATLAMAAGASRLAHRGVLLRQLGALEALGGVDTLCLDKTGTLTANAMTVREVRVGDERFAVTGEGWVPEGRFTQDGQPRSPLEWPALIALLRAGQICNDATFERHDGPWHAHGDPSEAALLVLAAKAGLEDPRPALDRLGVAEAAEDHPWMVVVTRGEAGLHAFAKGAPEEVLGRSRSARGATGSHALEERERQAWLAANRDMAGEALRVFGLAELRLTEPWDGAVPEEGWTWLGLVGMADPPRQGVREALAEAHGAGIRTLMLTGDQPNTARAIALTLGLAGDREPRVELVHGEPGVGPDVYARMTPEGKHALVRRLQAEGRVVAMTGDGVNDAPALRAAEVGVAMGGGVEVAKQAAAVVLTDERLATLLVGVREGRAAFFNIQKALDFLLTCSIATMLAVLLTTLAGFPLPLLPLQILYLNLLTHTFPALGLALEPASKRLMARPPLPRKARLLPPARLGAMLWHALMIAAATLGVGAWGLSHGGEPHGRTLAFSVLATALMLHTLSDRSTRPFGGWRLGGNGFLYLFLGLAIALQLCAIYIPPLAQVLGMTALDGQDWLMIVGTAVITVLAVETSKLALPPEEPPAEAP